MVARARFKSVHWMMFVVFALMSSAVLAQQDQASQGQNPQAQAKSEAAQPKKQEEAQKTEVAVKTEVARLTGVARPAEVARPVEVPGATEAAATTEAADTTEVTDATEVADGTDVAGANTDNPKEISGMSILGNQEAPKSLVIVPWKTSEIGNSIDISPMLDDSRQPVDREVFMRALSYYQIRSETKP